MNIYKVSRRDRVKYDQWGCVYTLKKKVSFLPVITQDKEKIMSLPWENKDIRERCRVCESLVSKKTRRKKNGIVIIKHRCLCVPKSLPTIYEHESYIPSNEPPMFWFSTIHWCRKNPLPYPYIIKLFHQEGD